MAKFEIFRLSHIVYRKSVKFRAFEIWRNLKISDFPRKNSQMCTVFPPRFIPDLIFVRMDFWKWAQICVSKFGSPYGVDYFCTYIFLAYLRKNENGIRNFIILDQERKVPRCFYGIYCKLAKFVEPCREQLSFFII